MENIIETLQSKLSKCRGIICTGYSSTKASGIPWLNTFCAEFGSFANQLHKFLVLECAKKDDIIQIMFLCLTQITTCIKHMEKTIKVEETGGFAISASRQHFLDRIVWCIDRIKTAINSAGSEATLEEETNFVTLMDRVLEDISPFSSLSEGTICSNVAEESAEAMFASKQIRSTVDMILSHTLAFANVTLKSDKKIISILCQKVIRECIAFQDACSLSDEKPSVNESDRKLKAMSLENTLYQLEDYINESLLRLVYTTFLDYNKFSVQNIRSAVRLNADDSALDDAIADFDVNVDRTTQIGVFAIAFAPNVKVKTTVRSALASLESLDSCIIPSLQSNCDIYSEILEQHFNEEVDKFKFSIQEIIDSNAFCTCYIDMLSEAINSKRKQLDRQLLTDVLEMGTILKEHLHLNFKYLEFDKDADKRLKHEKFILMLEECQAILACLNQVKPERVLKRFKILRSVLTKLRDCLADARKSSKKPKADVFITSEEMCDSEKLFASFGISPSTSSILYRSKVSYRQSACAGSLKGNYSRLNVATLSSGEPTEEMKFDRLKSIRRKDSLRTTMFKRQKTNESENMYKLYKENSTILHLTEIFDQIPVISERTSIAAAE